MAQWAYSSVTALSLLSAPFLPSLSPQSLII